MSEGAGQNGPVQKREWQIREVRHGWRQARLRQDERGRSHPRSLRQFFAGAVTPIDPFHRGLRIIITSLCSDGE